MITQIAAVTAVLLLCMFAGRRWIEHGRVAPARSPQRRVFLTIGRTFDTIAFIGLAVILFFLLMSI